MLQMKPEVLKEYQSRKLKIPTKQIFNKGLAGPGYSIKLASNSDLCEKIAPLNPFSGSFSEKDNFIEEFGLGCKFFYRAEKYSTGSSTPELTEIGVGYISEHKDGEKYLERMRPMVIVDKSGDSQPITAPDITIAQNTDGQTTMISAFFPDQIENLFSDPHIVIASSEYAPAIPVYIEENSVLGRKNGSVEAISISYLVEYLTSITKQVTFKASKLISNILKCKSIQIEPQSKKAEETAGTIFFDKDTAQLRYFDGTEWRTLVSQAIED